MCWFQTAPLVGPATSPEIEQRLGRVAGRKLAAGGADAAAPFRAAAGAAANRAIRPGIGAEPATQRTDPGALSTHTDQRVDGTGPSDRGGANRSKATRSGHATAC